MGTTASEKGTWWLIQNAAIIAVSPSRDASKEQDDDPRSLAVLQERLKSSRSKMLGDDTLLSPPRWNLTIQFDDGSHRTIAFGYHPPKLISACRISIDGTERVVMSPGLPEYDAITSRCQPFAPSSSENNTASGCSTIGILLSLLIYLAYVIIT
jgi:hypothetical protein